jgi:hypothetical protein
MAIRIKRSSGNTAPALLDSGQLAYAEGSTNGGTLYYGEIGGTVREIGGKKFVDKVNGIEAGAQVNTVTSVAGRTGAVTIGVADVSGAQATSAKGQANGYASLDSSGLVPSTQLPSYVDDVEEYANLAGFPATGSSGKIYVTVDTAKTYRWSGSTYVEISASPGSTDAVSEGSTNLYFTNARARQSISVTQNLSYDNTTGVITGPSLTAYATTASLATVATSGAYNDLTGKPSLFSGSYTDLTNKPTLFSGAYADLSGKPTLFSGSYTDLTNKPSIPSIGDMRFNLNGANGTMDTSYAGDLTIKNGASYAVRLDVGSGGVLAQQNFSRITAYNSGTTNSYTWEFKDDGKTYLPGFTLPATDGSANQVLSTNGSGVVSWSTVSAGGLADLIDDTTPQLGGNLDVNGKEITSVSNGNIVIAPNGSGFIVLNKDGTNPTFARRSASTGTASNTLVAQRNYTADVLANMDGHMAAIAYGVRDSALATSTFARAGGEYATDGNHSFAVEFSANNFTSQTRALTVAQNAMVVGPESGTTQQNISSLAVQNLVLGTNWLNEGLGGSITIVAGANGNVEIAPNGTGKVKLSGLSYPSSDGTAGQLLKTNGSGVLSFTSDIDDGTF